jgi:hypothetical protein
VTRRALLGALGASAAVSPFIPLLNAQGEEARPLCLSLWWHRTAPFRSESSVLDGLEIQADGVGAPHTMGPPAAVDCVSARHFKCQIGDIGKSTDELERTKQERTKQERRSILYLLDTELSPIQSKAELDKKDRCESAAVPEIELRLQTHSFCKGPALERGIPASRATRPW